MRRNTQSTGKRPRAERLDTTPFLCTLALWLCHSGLSIITSTSRQRARPLLSLKSFCRVHPVQLRLSDLVSFLLTTCGRLQVLPRLTSLRSPSPLAAFARSFEPLLIPPCRSLPTSACLPHLDLSHFDPPVVRTTYLYSQPRPFTCLSSDASRVGKATSHISSILRNHTRATQSTG